ncbi:hypothetical protein VTL71DRAFT_9525 [Oculimacula yallundae]|uniref:Thioesterase domain-containing protein n=1 Tax=Oculimacula yallundae TaxID=86028 RepID=A0ABR4BS62_9HELO
MLSIKHSSASQFAIAVDTTESFKSSNAPLLETKWQEDIYNVLQDIVPDLRSYVGSNDPLADLLPAGRLDSVLMVRFKQALEDKLQLKFSIPITLLFKVNTVADIEQELLKLSIATNPGLVTTFSNGGSKTPLFLFPPGGGESFAWLELIRYLPDRPVTFQSEMLALHPQGPYALLGLCFGGTLAFEVAKRFEARGEQVSFLGGIDNAPSIAHMRFEALRYFIVDILASRRMLSREEQAEMKSKLKDTHEDQFPQILMSKYRSRLSTVGITVDRMTTWQKVFYGVASITEHYEPTGKVSNYHSFYAAPRPEWGIPEGRWAVLTGSWAEFSRESYHKRVDGDHYTVLTKANIEVFKKALFEGLK